MSDLHNNLKENLIESEKRKLKEDRNDNLFYKRDSIENSLLENKQQDKKGKIHKVFLIF
jgi:hypothetical protein